MFWSILKILFQNSSNISSVGFFARVRGALIQNFIFLPILAIPPICFKQPLVQKPLRRTVFRKCFDYPSYLTIRFRLPTINASRNLIAISLNLSKQSVIDIPRPCLKQDFDIEVSVIGISSYRVIELSGYWVIWLLSYLVWFQHIHDNIRSPPHLI